MQIAKITTCKAPSKQHKRKGGSKTKAWDFGVVYNKGKGKRRTMSKGDGGGIKLKKRETKWSDEIKGETKERTGKGKQTSILLW